MTSTPALSALLEPGARTWDDDVDDALVCRAVVRVTEEISSFVLAPRQPRLFRHLPGQYLTLTVDVDGRPVSRCYTIASPPTRPFALTISVKREPGGLVSNWLHDRLAVGDVVHASGPYGDFTMAAHSASRYLFLSGGVGITPLMSMVRALHDRAEPADVLLVHSVRSPRHIVFRSELDHLAASTDGLRVAVICEQAEAGAWGGRLGRLTPDVLAELAPDLTEREVFLCGPAAYMEAAGAMLLAAGVDAARIHTESFALPPLEAVPAPPAPPAPNDRAGSSFAVEFSRSGRTVQCRPDVTVLQAAIEAGVRVPSSCGEGMCGTCKTTLLRGSVNMQHAGGIRPKEVAQNKILICCSEPMEDLVIDA